MTTPELLQHIGALFAAGFFGGYIAYRRGYRRGLVDGNPFSSFARALAILSKTVAAHQRQLAQRTVEEAEQISREAAQDGDS